ncbi:MAG: benzoate transporter [Gammaproteobacteria bacterium]|nr:MAG: benzoate transporter [Gammaproteobacteria bacterium]
MIASVSVVIPCYECEKTIIRAIKSVVAQTVQVAEIILIDDASKDGTYNLLCFIQKEYKDKSIKLIKLDTNKGASLARNEGWKVATSDYIAFLDADDSWHPRKIELQYQWMISHPSTDLTGHEIGYKNGDGSNASPAIQVNLNCLTITKNKILRSNCFSTPTVMVKRDINFRFDNTQYYAEDYLLWLSMICQGLNAVKLDLELAYMYKSPYGEAGLSQNLWAMEKGELEVYQKVYKLGYLRSYQYYFLCIYSLAKYVRRRVLRIFDV